MEVQSLGDASVKTQDLEDSRRELIALSGVPAPYKTRYGIYNNNIVEYRKIILSAERSFK